MIRNEVRSVPWYRPFCTGWRVHVHAGWRFSGNHDVVHDNHRPNTFMYHLHQCLSFLPACTTVPQEYTSRWSNRSWLPTILSPSANPAEKEDREDVSTRKLWSHHCCGTSLLTLYAHESRKCTKKSVNEKSKHFFARSTTTTRRKAITMEEATKENATTHPPVLEKETLFQFRISSNEKWPPNNR